MDTNPPLPSGSEDKPTEQESEKPKGKRPPVNSLSLEAERLKEVMKKLGLDEPEQGKP